MGAYRSRPAATLQDVWREDCIKSYSMVDQWIAEVCDVDPDPEIEGWTALHSAIYENDLGSVKVRGQEFASWVNSSTKGDLITPLHLCASGQLSGGNVSAATLLLEAGADPDARTKNGFSALHLAAATMSVNLVRLLGDHMARRPRRHRHSDEHERPGRSDGRSDSASQGVMPLHVAIIRAATVDEDEVVEVVQALLDDPQAGVNVADENGFAPLHLAAIGGHATIAETLLRAGADASGLTRGAETPLHLAVSAGRFRITSLLLNAAGVDVNAVDHEGNTPAHYSCQRGDLQILELLMTSPQFASLTTLNMYRNSPIHAACYQGRIEVINHLLRTAASPSDSVGNMGSSPSSGGRDGRTITVPQDLLRENIFSETALHAAATNGQSPLLVRTLLQSGQVPVNTQGDDGHTALHSACWNGNLEAARLLLEHGGDIRVKTHADQQTCVNWCHEKGYDEVLYMLHSHAEQLVQDLMHSDSDEKPPDPDDRPETCQAWQDMLAEITGLPQPSPMGKLRSITRKQADVAQLKNLLPPKLTVSPNSVSNIDQVGAGSFAKVYRAQYGRDIVAAKKYKDGHFHRKSNIDLFCREVSIHSRLEHPHILKFLGAVVDDPARFCILTEFIPGGSLYEVLHLRRASMDFRTRIATAAGVASGMEYLHGLKVPIIHRDLNSHNVLITEQMRAVIADFGESRPFNAQKAIPDAPKDLTLQPGNLRWMAPEIFRQNSIYTLKADVYSFGLVVWEIVTGQLPFGDFEPAAAAAQMAYHQQRPMISESCPKAVAVVISTCWDATGRSRPSFRDIGAWLSYKYPAATEAVDGGKRELSASTIKKIERVFQGDVASPLGRSAGGGYVKSVQVATTGWRQHDTSLA